MNSYFSIRKSKDGQYYFCIVAANKEVLATSEMYTQKHNCQKGIEAVVNVMKGGVVLVKEEYGEEEKTD